MSEGVDKLLQNRKVELAQKILQYKEGMDSDIGGECLAKGLRLYDEEGSGELWWVGNLEKIGLDFGLHHTYFIPNDAQANDQALNQKDAGFSQYPALTVDEVHILGERLNTNIVRELVNHTKKR